MCTQLNFACFRRQLKGFKKTTPNTAVIGFLDSDTYEDVIAKAAKSLDIHCDLSMLSLICSGGLVPDSPIGDEPWTLGRYIYYHGGSLNRGKKVWGINIPYDDDDERNTEDSVRYKGHYTTYKLILAIHFLGLCCHNIKACY